MDALKRQKPVVYLTAFRTPIRLIVAMKKLFLTMYLVLCATCCYASQNYKFSELEIQMDAIANKYGNDSSKVLQQMEKLLTNSPNATFEEKSLFLTYDCSLRAQLASSLAEDRLQELKTLSIAHSNNAAVRAATALCEAEVARFHKNKSSHKIALIKAFIFVQNAKIATLRYWIGLNIQDTFTRYQDYQSAEIALLMGLSVAEDNNDQTRLAAVHQLLAETYLGSEQYSLALNHNNKAQKATNNIEDKWYQSKIYTNRAFIMTKLNRLDQALAFHGKSLALTKKIRVYREVQFINLDIAYVLMLKGDNNLAKSLIDGVLDYAEQYDDTFLKAQSQIFYSLLLLKDENAIAEAQMSFEQGMAYLKENDHQESITSSWLQQAKTSKVSANYQKSNDAYLQYFSREKSSFITNNLAIKKLFAQAYQEIRLDDYEIAESKLAKATAQKYQISQNRQYFVIGVALLTIILFVILINFSWHLWKKGQLKKEEINRQRYYDPLTQAFNRRYFDDIICKKLLDDCQANKTSYLLLIDIDHFKSFNDTYGHSAGDTVLKELVHNLKGDSRLLDSVVRMGGEEFIIILSPDENLRIDAVVERILKLVSDAQIIIEDTPKTITISIGYIAIEKVTNNEEIEDLINLADKGLYVAKNNGRNRAIGIKELQCPANYIDKILIAKENKLLTLTEVSPS